MMAKAVSAELDCERPHMHLSDKLCSNFVPVEVPILDAVEKKCGRCGSHHGGSGGDTDQEKIMGCSNTLIKLSSFSSITVEEIDLCKQAYLQRIQQQIEIEALEHEQTMKQLKILLATRN